MPPFDFLVNLVLGNPPADYDDVTSGLGPEQAYESGRGGVEFAVVTGSS